MSEQRVTGTRRKYNRWVANQTMEDYALRFTAKSARRWSLTGVANTALGAISFLALEAIGGVITLNYGFDNAMAAVLVVSFIIFLTSLPISYYAARYGVDIDLLSRGASFGYIGSTITSLIYASFTFIFFALEAAIMASALELLFNLPLSIGYLVSSLVVIPLVTHGITFISRFQLWSQPLWLILQLTPFIFVLSHEWSSVSDWTAYSGRSSDNGFNVLFFGAASGVLFSLIAQIGEQVDFIRFLPEQDKKRKWAWWTALLAAGPGWIIVGALKIIAGSFLAVLALNHGVSEQQAGDPIQMYLIAFGYLGQSPTATLALAGIFVIVCQLKINVTNAYAGSIAWSNFFSRLTHSHPGRVVWLVFNVMIALLVMELGIYGALENTLGVYSNVAVAWVGALVADLVINKPLGLSPKHIEFKRAYLYDINPVGVGAMLSASILGITSYTGELGELAQALSPYIALLTAFIVSPIIAFLTKGRFYLARDHIHVSENSIQRCKICHNKFESEDMAYCPAYQGSICSLCCSLDVRCHDQCKKDSRLGDQLARLVSVLLPKQVVSKMNARLLHFMGLLSLISSLVGTLFILVYLSVPEYEKTSESVLSATLIQLFFLLLIIIGILTWLFVLANDSRQFALAESLRQTELLTHEINAHSETDKALQQAKENADAANHAKSRYLTSISHELRSPLNSILGFAQLLEKDQDLIPTQHKKVKIIRRNGDHLADLIEGLLDISRIEAGHIEIKREQFDLTNLLEELCEMFQQQAAAKQLAFNYQALSRLPPLVEGDEIHLRQILINLLSNAIKYTQAGQISFTVKYRSQVAEFTITDTGLGISNKNLTKIFEPFERIKNPSMSRVHGTGLGLTISKLLAEIMGGDIAVSSRLGEGSQFTLHLMLSNISTPNVGIEPANAIESYLGEEKVVMVVDDEENHRELMYEILNPLGFIVLQASNSKACLSYPSLEKIDLFLLDIAMPGLDGWGLLETLREQGISQPIIMVSANAYQTPDEPLNSQSQQSLHNGYLTKPVRASIVLEKVSAALALKWHYQTPSPNAVNLTQTSDNVIDYSATTQTELKNIMSMAELGFVQGINQLLIEKKAKKENDGFTAMVGRYLNQYQFAQIISLCNKGLSK